MHHLLSFLVFLITITACTAQRPTSVFEEITPFERVKKELQNNPDITWIGETRSNLRFQDFHSDNRKKLTQGWNDLVIQKLLAFPEVHGLSHVYNQHQYAFQYLLLRWLRNGTTYSDYQLTVPVQTNGQEKSIAITGTTVIHDLTEEEIWEGSPGSINSYNIYGIRVHQLLYWNEATKNYGFRPISFTPLLSKLGNYGRDPILESNLWFPIDVMEAPQVSWGNNDVSYIAETRHLVPISGPDAMSNIKGQAEIKRFMLPFREDTTIELRAVRDPGYFLSSNERAKLFQDGQDTTMTMSLDGHSDEVQLINFAFHWENIESLRLMNRWFWDNKSFRLSYEFLGWQPLLSKHDPQGGLYQKDALFYRKSN